MNDYVLYRGDKSAGDVRLRLIQRFQNEGIAVAFARVRDPVRASLQRAGVVDAVGAASFYDRLTDGVRAFQRRAADRGPDRGGRPAATPPWEPGEPDE
jgi:hypothetical protein